MHATRLSNAFQSYYPTTPTVMPAVVPGPVPIPPAPPQYQPLDEDVPASPPQRKERRARTALAAVQPAYSNTTPPAATTVIYQPVPSYTTPTAQPDNDTFQVSKTLVMWGLGIILFAVLLAILILVAKIDARQAQAQSSATTTDHILSALRNFPR